MHTIAIIQARMGSTRLPGKILKTLCGKTVLRHVINRVKRASELDEVVIATSTLSVDDVVERVCREYGVPCFRGSEDDVLSRYYHAAKMFEADTIVRITSDCPLIDPDVIDAILRDYKTGQWELVTNAGADPAKRTYPRGLDVEVFSFKVLEEAYSNAVHSYEREHVTPYIYENCSRIDYYLNTGDHSAYRWTLDTPEDLVFVEAVYEALYTEDGFFGFEEILALMEAQPELAKINGHIEQKKIIQKQ